MCVCLVVACVAIITQVKMFAHFSGNDAETKVDSLHKPAYKRITGSFRCIWMYTGYIFWMTAYHDTVLTHTHTPLGVPLPLSLSQHLTLENSKPRKVCQRKQRTAPFYITVTMLSMHFEWQCENKVNLVEVQLIIVKTLCMRVSSHKHGNKSDIEYLAWGELFHWKELDKTFPIEHE